MKSCLRCERPFPYKTDRIFCSTICAFKDYVFSNTNVESMNELIEFVKVLFKNDFEEEEE